VNAVLRAELLRLRTVRAPYFMVLVVLVAVVSNAIPLGNAHGLSPGELTSNLRGLLQIAAFFAAVSAALGVGAAFQLGQVAVTYTAHPRRAIVTAAHSISYAGIGAVLAALGAAVAAAIMLPLAAGNHVASGLSALRLTGMIAATAVCGAIFGAIGALVATALRNSTTAVVAIVAVQFLDTFVSRTGSAGHTIGAYLPVHLVGSATGAAGPVSAPAAIGLLLLYLAGLGALVRRLALYRDLT
jgi:ABC-2 type transport system permease protein